ncbi:unnamed protein product [Rotaria sp. Silwood2]|nr:unnamed protein product [Rotaria sp. Silwood2]CAF2899841.1 unnamed protein product [Rotaria sp. Silwood2]CAF3160573.1 unnamed protein product [Rotaria sp. Silwood2]CAF4235850.1 unnamed protein product [Rotaria sp. Silwood2]CAF4287831.1 unnamed protein product [Rotaria sp. Silwood2]
MNDQELTSSDNQTLDREILQEERFNEPITTASAYANDSQKNMNLYVEINERSSECFFSTNTLLHYFTLKCLMDNQSTPSDYDNLIELFRIKFSVPETTIDQFKKTYAPDQAIQFYTKHGFIYQPLNKALRSTNINHLVRFRFVLKDIYDQLGDLMALELNAQTREVYRGQQMHFSEIMDLFNSFKQNAPIIVNSFFSTSLDRHMAAAFLIAGCDKEHSMTHVPVLFTINIRKQDASSDCPFADISKLSNFDEEAEILFSPGQMFMIEKLQTIHEHDTIIYSIEMRLHNETKFNLNDHYNRLKSRWEEETHDSLMHLAKLLMNWKRYDEVKELYEQVLHQKPDKQIQIVCYQGLAQIASFTNNSDEAMIYQQKVIDLKFGNDHSSLMPDGILVSNEFIQNCSIFYDKCQNATTRSSLCQPLNQVSNYLQSNGWNEVLHQTPQMTLMIAQTLMSNQQYQLAILFLEPTLFIIRWTDDTEFDPLHKLKCYEALGYCYHHLGMNQKSLEYYMSVLDENIHLSPQLHVKILSDVGQVLEEMNQWEEALQKYIKAAEIYQTDLPNADPEDVAHVEKRIERVTSHLIPPD